MTGRQLLQMLQERLKDVHSCYLPCVAFLVSCQQELRRGVEANEKKPGKAKQAKKTLQQYYTTYIAPLPSKFAKQNRSIIDAKRLREAVAGLEHISQLAKQQANNSNSTTSTSTNSTCDAVKQGFLGGMHEGRSNGLRQWLSQHGQALVACTFLECLLRACMERVGHNNHHHHHHHATGESLASAASSSSSLTLCKQFMALMRPLAQQTHHRLVTEIPASYQVHTTGHPYLPFFHRLEAALRGMATYDPDDDDVVCIAATSATTAATAATATNTHNIDGRASNSSGCSGDKKLAAKSSKNNNNKVVSSSSNRSNAPVAKIAEIISIDDDDEDDDDSDNDNDKDIDDNEDDDNDDADSREESGELNSCSDDGNDGEESQEIISIHDTEDEE
jgi:hypothetical protein